MRRTALVLVAFVLIAACGDDGDEDEDAVVALVAPTFEEYEAAVARTLECLRDEGFVADAELQDQSGLFQITVGQPGQMAGPAVDAAYDRCSRRFLTDVEVAYGKSIGPSEAESRELLRACLVDEGLLTADATPDDVEELLREIYAEGTDADPRVVQAQDCTVAAYAPVGTTGP